MSRYPLSEWVYIDRAVARSVNLERDVNGKKLLERYQVTPMVCKVIQRFADSLEREKTNAWSLTGPYGAGKSSLCLFLLSLSSNDQQTRDLCLKKINQVEPKLGLRLQNIIYTQKGIFPAVQVKVVSRYEPLNKTLTRGLLRTLEKIIDAKASKEMKELFKKVQKLNDQEWPPTNRLVQSFFELKKIMGKSVFIVVDELGKSLEYQAHRAEQGDIFILQALAEMQNIFLWVCLHQAFSVYSSALTHLQKEEWQKIQGRFEDISYVEPPSRSFSIIKEALSVNIPEYIKNSEMLKWAKSIKMLLSQIRIIGFPDLEEEEILKFFPFHPLSVFLLGVMSRRFGQNERTIFSFLSSGEPNALLSFLNHAETAGKDSLPTLGLDVLYDYFCTNGALKDSGRAETQRLLEVQYIIASQGDKSPSEIKLLKTVGVLNLLSSIPGVVASVKMLHVVLVAEYYKTGKEVSQQLKKFVEQKILLYRKYADEYRLWEGSDFDLEKEILEAKGRIALRSISQTLETIVPQEPLVASRHSLKMGTIRKFNVRWCTEEEITKLREKPYSKSGDGTLWLMIGRKKNIEQDLEFVQVNQPVVIAYSQCYDQIYQLLINAAACKEVSMAPELERDGVARREAKFRARQALKVLQEFTEEAFLPSNDIVVWYALGKERNVPNSRELSKLLSEVFNTVYYQCPKISNEMLNNDKLSSAATAARNRVAEAMANNSILKNLGLEGFGPEVAIYRTVIESTGLHREVEPGSWELAAPDPATQPQLNAMWKVIGKLLSDADQEGKKVPLINIIEFFQKPPFGIRKGPILLFIVHYLLTNCNEVAVYEGKMFKPFFGDAEILLLLRRPELFSLRSYKPSGLRSQVISTYGQVLNTNFELTENIRNKTILSVVAPLTEFINTLPEYAKKTRTLSSNAIRLRAAITNTRDPQELLYKEIPEALGLSLISSNKKKKEITFGKEKFQEMLWQSLIELRDAFDNFSKEIVGRFLSTLSNEKSNDASLSIVRNDLGKKAIKVLDICFDQEFKNVLTMLASQESDDETWFSRVAATVMKKRIYHWEDNELEEWTFRIKDIKERLDHLYELKKQLRGNLAIEADLEMISVTGSDGKLLRKIMNYSKQDQKFTEAKEKLSTLDEDKRQMYLACLIEIMKEKGEFSQ